MEWSYPAARVTRLVGLNKHSVYTELHGKHEANDKDILRVCKFSTDSTHDRTNLVRRSANQATKAVAERQGSK